MEFTELNLWNKITEFVKLGTYINGNLGDSLSDTDLQITNFGENNYQLIVKPINGFPNSWVLILIKLVLMKYYPELNVHIFRPLTTIWFGARPSTLKSTLVEYDIFDTKVKSPPHPMFVIKNTMIMDADEDIIKYIVPRLSKTQVDDVLNECDVIGAFEAKTLVLRYINQQEGLVLEL